MQLKPPEFTAEPDAPFKNDLLGRKSQVEGFCRMLRGVDGHAVVSLDGPWGSGKTAFVRMSAAYLQSKQVRVVEFNAWHQGHTRSPLVDLVSALRSQIDETTMKGLTEAVLTVTARVATQLVKAGTSGLVDIGALDADKGQDLTTMWDEAEKGTTHFKEQLATAATKGDGPLIVLIDELDRCHPTYALELLATVRHLFNVDGVVVGLAINRTELAHSVQAVYGPDFSADRYLRRFADLHAQLLPPNHRELPHFLQQLLTAADLSSNAGYGVDKVLRLVGEAENCGLRDIQQATYHYGAALASFDQNSVSLEGIKLTIAALTVLRTLDRDAYRSISIGQIDGYNAIAVVRKSLTANGANRPSVADNDLKWLEGILYFFALYSNIPNTNAILPTIREDEFIEGYEAAVGTEGGDPAAVFSEFRRALSYLSWFSPNSAKTITDRIDMLIGEA